MRNHGDETERLTPRSGQGQAQPAGHTRTPLTRQNLMREAVAHYLAAEFCARRRTITIVAQTVS
jgi:hypothetical protein